MNFCSVDLGNRRCTDCLSRNALATKQRRNKEKNSRLNHVTHSIKPELLRGERARVPSRPRGPDVRPKRPYSKPRLVDFGDVRDLTMGISPGMGDSTMPLLFET